MTRTTGVAANVTNAAIPPIRRYSLIPGVTTVQTRAVSSERLALRLANALATRECRIATASHAWFTGVMRRRSDLLIAVATLALMACSAEPSSRSSPSTTSPPPTALGTTPTLTSLATPTLTVPAAPAVTPLDERVCLDPAPVSFDPSGAIHTIAVQDSNPERFAAVVVVDPASACPGDEIDLVVHAENLTGEPQTYVPHYGLLFQSGGPAKWPLGGVTLALGPLATESTVVTATVPAVSPGTYFVWVLGGGGEILVLDPATARSN